MAAESTTAGGGPRIPLRLVVGRVGKAHGLRGEVTVEVRTDDPDTRLAPGVRLDTEPAERGPLTVASGRVQGGRLVLAFEGVADRPGAEALRNTMLVVDADPDEAPDDPDEYFDHQLVGLSVVTVDGREVGTVAEMLHLPTQDLFAVRRADGREVLVPFVAEIVPEVDLAARRVVIDPPPGLLELADPAEKQETPAKPKADGTVSKKAGPKKTPRTAAPPVSGSADKPGDATRFETAQPQKPGEQPDDARTGR
jgi:16S rRNA processing protein RimM